MQQLFTTMRRLLLPLALGAGYTAWGQTYTQIALTGYNQDVIAEGTGAVPSLTTYDVDGSGGAGYSFMSANYVNPSNVANGATNKLPNNGLITSIATSGLTYQLAGYGASNVLRVPATGNTGGGTGTGADAGTITFATPSAASTVYVLATGGGGAITNGMTVTITFSDNTTQVFASQTLPDWFTPNGATVAYQGFGRVARTAASGIDNTSATTPNLYQLAYTILPANVGKPIASITFGKTVTGVGVIDVFAVSTASYPVCAATPSNLSAVATTSSGGSTALTSACASTSIYLSVTGLPANTVGYTYQWQASTTGATTGFADISGATGSTYTATGQTAATYYRVVVRCLYDGAGGTVVPSSAVQVTQNPATSCYCVPAHSSTSTSYTSITTVTLPGDGGVTLTNSPGLLASPYYAIYPASTTTTALSVNGSYTLTVAAIAFQRISAWIDYDQSGTFEASEFYILKNASGAIYSSSAGNLTTPIVLPPGALTGPTRLRIRSDYYNNTVLNTGTNACATTQYGEALDYTVTVTATPCTSAAPAPTITSPVFSTCAGTAFTLTASQPPVGFNGYTYQWQSSPAGANTFTNLGSAQTATTYAVASQTAATDYRVLLLCAAGGSAATATSNVVTVGQNPFYYCTCTPVTSGTGTDGITNVTLGTLNNTSSATNASPYYTDYSSTQLAGQLPTPVLTTGGSATVSVKMGSDSNQYSGVWIDFDHSGTFDASEFFTLGTNAGSSGTSVIPVTVPASALTGLTKMRVRGGNDVVLLASQSCTAASSSSNYGEVEDYLVNIGTATACGGTLPATAATASTSAACTATAGFTLNVTGLTAGTTGLSYQWQSSPAGTNNYTNIAGATTVPYTVASQTASTDYRVVVTCTASGSTSTSSPVTVGQQATCYCAPVSTGTNEYIESVTLPGFNGFTNSSLVNTPGGYADYTTTPGLTTTLNQGVSYPVTVVVRSNNGGSQGGIWIDFDHSGTFDASEYTLLGTSSAIATDVPFTVTVAVPGTALLGPARVRVRWRNSAFTSADACTGGATTWYGETEDYLINIVAPCTPSTATFSYGGAPFCVSGTTNPTVTLASGGTAGTFTATPAGLTINASTGAITLSSSTPGTYTVTNTVAATSTRCASSATTTVTINAAPTAGFAYGAGPYCVSGTTNPTVTLGTGATAGTYSATPAGLTLDASTGAITLSSSTPGTYTVTNTVAAANGCAQVTATSQVTINAAPTAGFSYPTTTVCAGTATTLTPTLAGGATSGTYALSSTTGLSVNANGVVTIGTAAVAGTYTVTNTVAAANGCAAVSSTASFTITPVASSAFSYGSGTYCVSGTTNPAPTITGTTGGTFTAAPAGLAINAGTGVITLSSSTSGTYTVTYAVSAACGSSSTASVTITSAPAATFSYPAGTNCAGSTGSVTPTLTGGASAGTFTASPAGLTINASTGVVTLGSSAAGTYTVTNTIAASGGCSQATATATLTLTPQTTATFSYPAGSYCVSGTTNPAATVTGTAGGTFSSTTGLTINASTGAVTLSSSTPGTYVVTYTVSGACGSSSTQTLIINAAPTAAFSYGAGPYCVSGTTNPAVTLGTGGTAGTYSATPAGLTINATTGAITLSSSTPGTYTVTNTVAASVCWAAVTSTATVTITAAPTASFSYQTGGTAPAVCAGTATTLTAALGTGATAGTFSLPATTGLTVNASTGAVAVATTAAAGTYTVTNTVAASGGCAASTSTATFTVNAAPATPAISVTGTPATGITLGSSSATGNQFYLNNVLIPGATGQSYIVLSGAGNGNYTVTVTNAAGCSATSAPVAVTVTPTARAAAGTSLTLYPNPTRDGQLTLELSGYQEPVQLQVLNALGQRVYEATLSGSALTQKQALNLSALPAGVYLLQARTASGQSEVRRFVREQ